MPDSLKLTGLARFKGNEHARVELRNAAAGEVSFMLEGPSTFLDRVESQLRMGVTAAEVNGRVVHFTHLMALQRTGDRIEATCRHGGR